MDEQTGEARIAALEEQVRKLCKQSEEQAKDENRLNEYYKTLAAAGGARLNITGSAATVPKTKPKTFAEAARLTIERLNGAK